MTPKKNVKAVLHRQLKGFTGILTRVVFLTIPILGVAYILELHAAVGLIILREQYFGLFYGLILFNLFLYTPATSGSPKDRVPWYDYLSALSGLTVGMYVALFYPQILREMGIISTERIILGTIAIGLTIESLRRKTGWILPIVGLLFMGYARFTWLAPGIFYGDGVSWTELINYLYLDTNGMFGAPMMVCAVIVLAFILFGNTLFGAGGASFLGDFAMALFGRFRGGPAKMAIVASSLFGTLSGTAVGNVASTGVITIPLMKRSGYPAHLAGAIEAVASTAGQLTPPIMGAAAFIIAEFTGNSYATVALAALVPAVLYYVGVFVQVDLEAGKANLTGMKKSELPVLKSTLKQSYLFVIPLTILILALFGLNMPPGKAAVMAVFSVLVVCQINPKTRFKLSILLDSLEKTGKNLVELTVIVAMAGLVIGVINLSGLGFIVPMALVDLGGNSIVLLLIIVALACIILGMGMPTVAVYILLSVLMAPSMVQLGIDELSAHLFILYFGTLSMYTPPICLAAFAAATIAESPPMKTAFTSMRIGILAYPVPFLFVASQTFLLKGALINIVIDITTALIGTVFIGCSLVGYLFRSMVLPVRFGFFAGGIGLLIPASGATTEIGLCSNIVGTILCLLLVYWEWRRSCKLPKLKMC